MPGKQAKPGKRSAPREHREELGPRHGFYFQIEESLFRGRSRFQEVELVQTEPFGKVLLLDGAVQVFDKNEFQYHEPLVHPALLSHPNPRRVLVIGAGDGGALREVCRYKTVEQIDLAELDGEVIQIAREKLPSLHAGAFDDPRVCVHVEDGRAFVERNPGRYDVVLTDMTDPAGPSAMLYTREFFRSVRRSLRDARGIFSMHAESADDRPLAFASIIKTNRAVFAFVRPFFSYVQQYGAFWCFLHSSDKIDAASIRPGILANRMQKRGLRAEALGVYTPEAHAAMAVGRPYIARIIQSKAARLITDRNPAFPDAW